MDENNVTNVDNVMVVSEVAPVIEEIPEAQTQTKTKDAAYIAGAVAGGTLAIVGLVTVIKKGIVLVKKGFAWAKGLFAKKDAEVPAQPATGEVAGEQSK